ncbi:VWA domain-containing protein [Komagataeibacter sp. FNDCR1]|nr:VWA domain-containing protein [Komagataeibacter sp. FNDCR1]
MSDRPIHERDIAMQMEGNLSINYNLKKKFEFQLKKKELLGIRARVGFAEDVSPSMDRLYASGLMDQLNERILPVAIKFDDNAEMDVASFDTRVFELPGMTEGNFDGYVRQHLTNGKRSVMGGTCYGPPIMHFRDMWFNTKPKGGFLGRIFGGGSAPTEATREKQDPAILILQTDGDNQDRHAAEQAVQSCMSYNMYITFMTVGREDFSFVKYLADKYPNVGFLHIPDLRAISDEELYEALITDELATWLKNAAV